MKYIKTFEKVELPTYYYKIPANPLEKYLVALHKIGMAPREIERWSSNVHAAYWNSIGDYYKDIILVYQYNVYTQKYSWAWTDTHAYIEKTGTIIDVDVEDYEIDANKYNL